LKNSRIAALPTPQTTQERTEPVREEPFEGCKVLGKPSGSGLHRFSFDRQRWMRCAVKLPLQTSFGVGHTVPNVFQAVYPGGFGNVGIHVAQEPCLNGWHRQAQGDLQRWQARTRANLSLHFRRDTA